MVAAVAGGLALAVFAFCQVAGQTIARTRPDFGVALAPWDGTAAERLAAGLYRGALAANPDNLAASPAVTAIALRAYRAEPLVPSALALISTGLDVAKRGAFLAEAGRVSRRDVLLQAMLLQHYARNNRFAETIRTLNQILQVREAERPVVFAQLTALLRDDRAVAGLREILATRPAWGNAFFVAAAREGGALDNLAELRRTAPAGYVEPETDRVLINIFVSKNRLSEAFDLYENLPGKSRSGPAGWSSDIPPIDWALANSTGLRARREGDAPDLHVSIGSGHGGMLAQRIMRAQPGPIRIKARYAEPSAAADRALDLSATCVPRIIPLGRAEFRDGRAELTLKAAPQGCDFMRITLSGRVWSEDRPLSLTMPPMQVEPVE